MARQQHQQERKQQSHATDLLNFHFSTSPPSQSRPANLSGSNDARRQQQQQQRRPGQQQQQQQHRQSKQQQQRSKEDRASARRKPSTAMFYLHSSADHAFVLTRRVKQQSGTSASSYTFSGPDEPVSWEAVRLVKYLAPAAPTAAAAVSDSIMDMTASCPICLDAFTCARITKCGHCFCLPCLLRHVHSHTAQNVYTHVKCPCCGIPLHLEDVRAVVIESVQPPRVGSAMTLVKLHRAKHCYAPYLPLYDQRRHASPHAAPCSTDADAAYTRFNYVDPFAYQDYLVRNEDVLQKELATLAQQRQRVGENYHLDMEILFYTMSLEMVQKDLVRARQEAEEEQSLIDRYNGASSGIYQPQPVQLTANYFLSAEPSISVAKADAFNADTAGSDIFELDHYEGSGATLGEDYVRHRRDSVESENAAHESQGEEGEAHDENAEMMQSGGHRRYRGNSIGSEMSAETPNRIRRARSESITSHGSVESDRMKAPQQQPHHRSLKLEKRALPDLPASMYLDHDASHFYQSTDGQLCFLSRFNMTCLLSDFSTWRPDVPPSNASTPFQRRKMLPLPDSVEGLVIETETVHLTPDTRKRMPFLSHLPLYTDVCFVELDLNSILSDVTKVKLKPEFEKRRLRRKSKIDAQKRADRIAQKKEEARVNELKSRIQRVDPNDDFFRIPIIEQDIVPLTGEGFGPALSSSSVAAVAEGSHAADAVVNASSPKPKTLSFSQICKARTSQASGMSAAPREEFPALGSAPPQTVVPKNPRTPTVPPGWNDRIKAAYVATKQNEDEELAAAVEEVSMGGKKKSKGKKIVLFSTGAQRGGSAF